MVRSTHTLALMQVEPHTYRKIRKILEDAGYRHAISEDGTLDMNGIGIVQEDHDG